MAAINLNSSEITTLQVGLIMLADEMRRMKHDDDKEKMLFEKLANLAEEEEKTLKKKR